MIIFGNTIVYSSSAHICSQVCATRIVKLHLKSNRKNFTIQKIHFTIHFKRFLTILTLLKHINIK